MRSCPGTSTTSPLHSLSSHLGSAFSSPPRCRSLLNFFSFIKLKGHVQVVPGRMALLVTLFLVLINIFNNVTNVSPNTEGMTAISSWMLGRSNYSLTIVDLIVAYFDAVLFPIYLTIAACIFFLFGALMSYAFILYILLQQKLTKQRSKR